MSWLPCTIGDICEVFDGPHATPPASDSGPIYLGITSIRSDGSIDFENSKRISYDDFPKWTKRVTPQEDDVVFSYEANLNSYAIIPKDFEGCLGRRMAIMRPNLARVLPRFLYYYMLSPQWKKVIAHKTVLGATVNRIPIASYSSFPLSLPPLADQERIAAILSAYDSLIENNRKQIKLLEEAAQRLYKEWFVDLRFPGHESTPINPETNLPEGWRKTSLGEFAEFQRGKIITEKQTEAGRVPVVAGGLEPAYYHSEANTKGPVITISGSGANAGFTRLYPQDVWASDCSFIDSTKCGNIYFVFESVLLLGNGFKHLQRGSAQPHVYPKHINALEITLSDERMLDRFEKWVSSLFDKASLLSRQIENATEARDRLLPKLMSGEIEV